MRSCVQRISFITHFITDFWPWAQAQPGQVLSSSYYPKGAERTTAAVLLTSSRGSTESVPIDSRVINWRLFPLFITAGISVWRHPAVDVMYGWSQCLNHRFYIKDGIAAGAWGFSLSQFLANDLWLASLILITGKFYKKIFEFYLVKLETIVWNQKSITEVTVLAFYTVNKVQVLDL